MRELPEGRKHIVLRYFWIDRRDLCANEAERAYYDMLTTALTESRADSAGLWRRLTFESAR